MTPQSPSARQLWIRLLLYPGHTLPTAVAPVLVGIGLAYHDHVYKIWPAFLGLLGSWLIHVGGVFADNHQLLKRYPTVLEHPELNDAVTNGHLRLSSLNWATLACFALGVTPGLYLAWVGGPFVAALGVLGLFASLGYAAGRMRYARFGLADPLFLAMFGLFAVVGTYYIQAVWNLSGNWSQLVVVDAIPLTSLWVGLPVGALVTNVLVIDDIRDRTFDEAKGWRTTAVRFGLKGSRLEFLALSVFAYVWPSFLWLGLGFSSSVLLPLVSAPLAFQIARKVMTKDSTQDLLQMTPRQSRLCLIYALLLGFGLAISM